MTDSPDIPDVAHATVEDGPGERIARLQWGPDLRARGWQAAVDVVRHEVAAALTTHDRVEVTVPTDDVDGQRIATWSGLRKEGVQRRASGDLIVYARLVDDVPVHEPGGFRALLNSFLPRKRGIAQMLIRDPQGRVLLCQLTYKQDWDLPGGVVEVGESPRLAVSREVEEELSLEVPAGDLLLTDWLPPWGGWDDAICLVFDGGVHDPGIVDAIVKDGREIKGARFCTVAEVDEHCADFTARRIRAALDRVEGSGPAYTESGRDPEAQPTSST